MENLNIALIGCGMIGREHIERIQNRIRNAKVVAVCDVFEEGAKKGAEIAGAGTKVYTDFNEAINDPDVNAVVVTTPGQFHKGPVLAAIKAGKPVFSEKPLANTAADGKEIVEAEMAGGKHLVQVGFMRRYDRGYRQVKELIDSGKFVYIGYVTCINDPKYITVDLTGGGAELKLTDYAREHVAECCLVYSYRSTSYLKDEYEFYGESYLSKEVKADYYVEHTYDKDFNYKCVQTADQIAEAVAAYNAAQDAEKKVRMEMAAKGCDTFADSLKYHMTRKKVKVEELSERSGLSDTTIKNYRSGTIPYPPIENVMAVCIGLNLHRPYCIDLLRTANYQINNDDPRSREYRFLLDYTDGTLLQWNMILDQFGQPHIPYQRNQKIAE